MDTTRRFPVEVFSRDNPTKRATRYMTAKWTTPEGKLRLSDGTKVFEPRPVGLGVYETDEQLPAPLGGE